VKQLDKKVYESMRFNLMVKRDLLREREKDYESGLREVKQHILEINQEILDLDYQMSIGGDYHS
jgi:hypothetical protein